MSLTFDSRALDAVVRSELLPRLLMDTPGVDLFEDWMFTGLQMEPQHSDLVGTVRARRRGSNVICQYRVVIPKQTLMYNSSTQHMLMVLDQHIEEAVKWIVRHYAPHREGQLCDHNAFCERCYA